MDLSFIKADKGHLIKVNTVHGMLWLQTHFEKEFWDSIASNEVIISSQNSEMLFFDATKAGIKIDFIKDISITRKFSKPH